MERQSFCFFYSFILWVDEFLVLFIISSKVGSSATRKVVDGWIERRSKERDRGHDCNLYFMQIIEQFFMSYTIYIPFCTSSATRAPTAAGHIISVHIQMEMWWMWRSRRCDIDDESLSRRVKD